MIISKIFRRGFGPVLLPAGPTLRALIEGGMIPPFIIDKDGQNHSAALVILEAV